MRHRLAGALRVTGGALLLAGLAACQNQKKPAPPPANPPASADTLAAVRAKFQAINPDYRVGQVTAVRASDHLLAVGAVDVREFHTGDVLSITDANANQITLGTVDTVDPNMLIVKYQPPTTGAADPVVGDLAIRLIK